MFTWMGGLFLLILYSRFKALDHYKGVRALTQLTSTISSIDQVFVLTSKKAFVTLTS